MKTLRFKTNINCSGCVSAIKPHFRRTNDVVSWKVDLNNPGKILIVTGENLKSEKIIKLVEEAGFVIKEEINSDLI